MTADELFDQQVAAGARALFVCTYSESAAQTTFDPLGDDDLIKVGYRAQARAVLLASRPQTGDVFKRDGNGLFTYADYRGDRGPRSLVNRLWVGVHRDPRFAMPSDVEALLAHVEVALTPSPLEPVREA